MVVFFVSTQPSLSIRTALETNLCSYSFDHSSDVFKFLASNVIAWKLTWVNNCQRNPHPFKTVAIKSSLKALFLTFAFFSQTV